MVGFVAGCMPKAAFSGAPRQPLRRGDATAIAISDEQLVAEK
jgi:hypothetical protein